MKPKYAKKTFSEVAQCEIFFTGAKRESFADTYQKMADYEREHKAGRDGYGNGKFLNQFEDKVAKLLGKESALYMPSGAMAQQIALRIFAEKEKSFKTAFHGSSQLELNENHAYKYLHGLEAELIGEIDRQVYASDLQSLDGACSFLLELPMRQIGGTLPTWDELEEIKQTCKEKKIHLQMDGARLWECKPFYQKTYAEICEGFESVYVSLYKALGGFSGAMLAGDNEFIEEAKVWLRRHGGNLYNQTPSALSAYLNFDDRLAEVEAWHKKAVDLGEVLGKVKGIEVLPKNVQTHMFHLKFNCSVEEMEVARNELAEKEKIWPFFMLAPLEEGGCKTEFTVGAATLEQSTDFIKNFFERLMEKVL